MEAKKLLALGAIALALISLFTGPAVVLVAIGVILLAVIALI